MSSRTPLSSRNSPPPPCGETKKPSTHTRSFTSTRNTDGRSPSNTTSPSSSHSPPKTTSKSCIEPPPAFCSSTGDRSTLILSHRSPSRLCPVTRKSPIPSILPGSISTSPNRYASFKLIEIPNNQSPHDEIRRSQTPLSFIENWTSLRLRFLSAFAMWIR